MIPGLSVNLTCHQPGWGPRGLVATVLLVLRSPSAASPLGAALVYAFSLEHLRTLKILLIRDFILEKTKPPLFTEMHCFCYKGVTDKTSELKFLVKIDKATPTLL